MPLINTKSMFKKAYMGHYAIGAFNVCNMESVQGIALACKETQSPVIFQVSPGAQKYAGIKYLAAAIAVGLACLAGGIAVAKIGSSAMGAMSENPELSGKALPFVGLAEGICLWGMLVGVLILFK